MKTKTTAVVQVKAGPDAGLTEGQFTAYASVFGNKDSYGDVVVPGAFAKTLAAWEAKDAVIPLLFGHRMDDPDFNIGHLLDAKEDDHGLLVKAQLDLENPKAAQTYRLLKSGRIDQMSFAYDVVEGAWVKKDGDEFYELRELALFEVSVVPIGANQETEVLAVKRAARELAGKAGRVIAAKDGAALRTALSALVKSVDQIADLLDDDPVVEPPEDDQEKAAPAAPANAEEPSGAKAEEPRTRGPARALAELQLLTLTEGEGGSL